jgi:hypothetical protein
MKATNWSRKFKLKLFCLVAVVAAVLVMWFGKEGKSIFSDSKPAIQAHIPSPMPNSEVKESATLPASSSSEGKGKATEDYLTKLCRETGENLINPWGEPNGTVIYYTVASLEKWSPVKTKLMDTMTEIFVMLRKRNEGVPPLPWGAGVKAHLKGLTVEELSEVNRSLQTVLKGMADPDAIEQISKRFSEESKAYTYSFEIEVGECRLPKGQYLVLGGAYRPLWFHEIERDEKGSLVSDKQYHGVNPSLLATQFIPARQISTVQK